MPIRSYLTPVTGFKPGDLDEGVDLDSALDELYSYLHPNVILVGQAIQNDVAWTRLVKGKHYSEAIDIAHIFKTTSSHGITYTYHWFYFLISSLLKIERLFNLKVTPLTLGSFR